MEYSMYKTFAAKYKTSIGKIRKNITLMENSLLHIKLKWNENTILIS